MNQSLKSNFTFHTPKVAHGETLSFVTFSNKFFQYNILTPLSKLVLDKKKN